MTDIFDLFQKIAKKEESAREPISWLIVGLGNPGSCYAMTRHNAGFLTVDYLAEQYHIRIERAKYHALCGEGNIGRHRVLLLKPQTMMNASGLAVQEAVSFYKLPLERILIISDDVTQAPGRMRLRRSGSSGGQKGLGDIINCLGSDAVLRLRMGVGQKPHPNFEMADWVLSELGKEDREKLFASFPTAKAGIELLLDGKFDAAQQLCNSFKA